MGFPTGGRGGVVDLGKIPTFSRFFWGGGDSVFDGQKQNKAIFLHNLNFKVDQDSAILQCAWVHCLFVCLFDWLVMLWRQEGLFNTWLPAAEWELPEKCGIFGHLAFAFPVLDNNQNPLWWFSLFLFISTSFALCSPDVVWWLKWIHATLTANAKINKHDSTTFGHLLLKCTLHGLWWRVMWWLWWRWIGAAAHKALILGNRLSWDFSPNNYWHPRMDHLSSTYPLKTSGALSNHIVSEVGQFR